MLKNVRKSGLPYQIFDFFGEPIYIICNGLNLDVPRKSSSLGSQAIYLIRKDAGIHSHLLQLMPPRSVTSRHYHRITTEYFHNLRGECTIEVNGEDRIISGCILQVNKFETHQVKTGDRASLNLIEMIGNPAGLSMNDHYYSQPI